MKWLIITVITVLVIVVASVTAFIVADKTNQQPAIDYIHNEGFTQGTTYSVTYQQPDGIDLQKKIEKRLAEFNFSLSTYEPRSVISRINRNDSTVSTDADFEYMFKIAREVSEKSNGAFDITVGPLVKAWGFGANPDREKQPDVKKMLRYVGFHKIKIENHKLIKSDPHIVIDANAIAQGYSTDIIAKLLENNGCKNYMIEIGGEIVCKGLNPKGQKWHIGIDSPVDNPVEETAELDTVVSITDAAITTSGNYRKFYYRNGKKIAHTIDPRTGCPVSHNMLSATVVAPTCIVADAYATAFMVLGVDSSLQICKSIPGMDCYLIYAGKDGKNKVVFTDGFKKYLTQ